MIAGPITAGWPPGGEPRIQPIRPCHRIHLPLPGRSWKSSATRPRLPCAAIWPVLLSRWAYACAARVCSIAGARLPTRCCSWSSAASASTGCPFRALPAFPSVRPTTRSSFARRRLRWSLFAVRASSRARRSSGEQSDSPSGRLRRRGGVRDRLRPSGGRDRDRRSRSAWCWSRGPTR